MGIEKKTVPLFARVATVHKAKIILKAGIRFECSMIRVPGADAWCHHGCIYFQRNMPAVTLLLVP